jgi:hypothetical protein
LVPLMAPMCWQGCLDTCKLLSGVGNTTTQNVMAAMDFDLKFTYVLASWEGSAHDAIILSDAIERNDGFTVPEGNCIPSQCTYVLKIGTHTHSSCLIVGKFYLVDADYACRSGFRPPLQGVRYYLTEFGSRNDPTNARELFNLKHSSLRVTMERAFGALKNMFHILDNKALSPIQDSGQACISLLYSAQLDPRFWY